MGRRPLCVIIGEKIGNFSVVKNAGIISHKQMVVAICGCGTTKIVTLSALRKGDIKSCGCLKNKLIADSRRKHGYSKTKEYSIWNGMRRRCFNEKCPDFKNYGGRGISICGRWLKFENFLLDMGKCPPGYSIERINVNGNYCKSNCKWEDGRRQSWNRVKTKYVTLSGVRKSVSEWCFTFNAPILLVLERIRKLKWYEDERLFCVFGYGYRYNRMRLSQQEKENVYKRLLKQSLKIEK